MLQRGQRTAIAACKLSTRDVAIIRDVWRYRFLTTEQIGALHFPGRTPQALRRRLAKLFAGGHLERFRPYSRRGSYPWTYHLGPAGHQLLRRTGHIEPQAGYQPRQLVDYSCRRHQDVQWLCENRGLQRSSLASAG
jgi:hypothetical protein